MAVNDNARYAYRYLIDKYKLQPHQAAGIVGNLMQESSLNTGARNRGDGRDGSDSIGIAQWNGQRARNLKSFGGDSYNTLDTQLDFVMHEMNGDSGKNGAGSERAAYQRLMASKDLGGATSAFIGFERPQGWSADNPTGGHGYRNRLNYAGAIAGLSPEEIAAAQPTSSLINADLLPASGTTAVSTDTKPKSHNGPLVNAFNKLTGKNVQVPDTIGGVSTDKVAGAFSGLGDFAAAMNAQTDQLNAQIAANASRGRAPSQPVEVSFLSTEVPTLNSRKKRRGGLGGIGGYLL